jgi:anaerobic magnesium-protoporphyrin IX monomethyl ester cyclase
VCFQPVQWCTQGCLELSLDAILIADSGVDTLSATSPLRLSFSGRTASIQVILNCLAQGGRIVEPIEGDGVRSWASAYKLNGISLFNYLTKQGFEIALINNYSQEKSRFCALLRDNPRAVIVSTTFIPGKKPLRKLVEEIRSVAPGIFIVAGGPLVYISYLMLQRKNQGDIDTEPAKEDFLFLSSEDEPLVDMYIVSLRGERLLVEALRQINKGRLPEDLPNTVRFVNGKSYDFSGVWDDGISEDALPIDWLSLPDSIFQSGVVPLQASTGCPYRCAFCNFTKDRRLTDIKPLDLLLEEMKAVSQRGARYIWFVDDNFRLGKHDLNSVCERILKEEINVSWMSFVRASTLRDVDVHLLKAAGCQEVQLGLESAHPGVLKNMNKKATPGLYSTVLRRLLEAGINCSCYFIFGFPGETEESIACTREFVKGHQFPEFKGYLSWSIYPFILTPLSPIYEPGMRQKYGLTGHMYRWKHQTMNSDQAREHVLRAFLELENSGPIYREDNQDILAALGPVHRKRFEATRQQVSKAGLKTQIKGEDICKAFESLRRILDLNRGGSGEKGGM